MIVLHERVLLTWRGLNPQPSDHQLDSRMYVCMYVCLIVLGSNDTSTLVGQFVSSLREKEKRDRRSSRRDERKGQIRKRKRNESEETEEIKTFPLLRGKQALPNCQPISVGRPGDVRYSTPSHHPITPLCMYVCMYVCTYVRTCACVCVLGMCAHVFVCVCVFCEENST